MSVLVGAGACRSAEEILQLLEGDEVRSFDFVNLVTALHRVAKLGGALYAKDARL